MAGTAAADAIWKDMQTRGVEFVFAQFVDMYARPSAKLVPVGSREAFDGLLEDGAGFAGFAAGEIGQMPSEDQVVANAGPSGDESNAPKLGVALAKLTPETRQQLNLSDDTKGVVVTDVQPGSPAAQKGLQAGDVIVQADRQQVNDPKSVADAVRKAAENGQQTILLLVKREGQDRFVAIPLERA